MPDNPTKLSITGRLTYSDEITVSQATQIIAFLNADESESAGLGGAPGGSGITPRKSKTKQVETAREAIEVSGAKTNPEKILAVAAYILQDGADTFKAEDVKSQFRRAREPLPANFGRDLSAAISAGWISEDDNESGEYYLHGKTDGIFGGGFTFSKGSSGGGRSRSGRKAAKAKSTKPDTLSDIHEFPATVDGYPPYSKMKSEKDRLLWVATYMRDKQQRKGVTNKEIAWISDHIGAGIPTNHIARAFDAAKGPGYAIRSTIDNTIKVTDEGVQYLVALATKT
jgi:hypothetical protein